MNAWQLDVMKDQMDTEAWNALNAPDPNEDQLKSAGAEVGTACKLMACAEVGTACKLMACAEDYIINALDRLYDDDSVQAKLGSFLEQLEDLRHDLSALGSKYERGEKG